MLESNNGVLTKENIPDEILKNINSKKVERRDINHLKETLAKTKGGICAAARILGVTEGAIRNRIKRYKINLEEFKQ